MDFFSKVGDACLDFFFPKKSEVLALESVPSGELLSILPPAEGPNEPDVLCLFKYESPLVRELVWEVKYSGNKRIADKLGESLYDSLCDELYEEDIFSGELTPLIVPMPISDKRRFERGWNQAELIAEAIKKRDKDARFKYLPRQLIKFRHTESQTHTASKNEREENIRQTMKVLNPAKIEGRLVILIDDVYTTGATAREAKRALKEAGARKVLVATVAH